MFEIRRYHDGLSDAWNELVARSKNGTFLFDRRYMDYHSDRFHDCSLMIYDAKGLYALLPANRQDDTLFSHQGLTYGGLITDERASAAGICELFLELNGWLRSEGVRRVVYKPVPWIYHRLPSEEDLYALFVICHARLVGRDLSSALIPKAPARWSHGRRYAVSEARKKGVCVAPSDDFSAFWPLLTRNLQTRYGVSPVHTLEEMQRLYARFPERIRLYLASAEEEVVGGTILYLCDRVAHAQYISASEKGKQLHAIDALYEQILRHDYTDMPFFDFGKSTVGSGCDLNEQLVFQKEGFGARAVCYDTYEWTL